MSKILNFFRNFPEVKWAFCALALWYVSGLILEPFTATYGLSFVQKITITMCRIALAISLTELVVHLQWPTLRDWGKRVSFRELWNAPEHSPADRLRLQLTVAVYLSIFASVTIALSL